MWYEAVSREFFFGYRFKREQRINVSCEINVIVFSEAPARSRSLCRIFAALGTSRRE
jgi:hypothetical protein